MAPAKRYVEIFIGPIACSCAGGPSPAKQEKIALAFALKNALEKEEGFDVRTWRLGEDDDYEEGMRTLTVYLEKAGEEELAANLSFAVNSATPSVAVEGRLEYLAEVPTPERFLARVRNISVED
jgi:hypothetical protein